MSKKNKRKKYLLSLLSFFMLFGVATVEDSGSFFSNLEKSLHNKFSSASWAVTEYELGDIIINEVHWPSSPAGDDDQWIELFNTTDEDISLTGWILENASNPTTLNIVGNPIIEADSFLIITRRIPNSSQSALAVSTDVQNASIYFNRAGYEQITLKDPSGEIIDQTPEKEGELVEWPAGEYADGEKYFSMQRKDNTKEDGTTPDSWYTCDPGDFTEQDELITMRSYWKEEYQTIVCGTPKHPNLPTNIASPQTAGFLSIDKNKPSDVQGEIKGLSDDEKDSVKDIAFPSETETTEEPTDEMRIEEEEEEDAEEKEAHQPTEQKEESEETVKKENITENDDERDDDNEEEFSSKEDEDNTYRAENDDLDEMVKENDIDQKVADKDVDMSDESDNPEKPETSESYE